MCVASIRFPRRAYRVPPRATVRGGEADIQVLGVQQRPGKRRVLRTPEDGAMERGHDRKLKGD